MFGIANAASLNAMAPGVAAALLATVAGLDDDSRHAAIKNNYGGNAGIWRILEVLERNKVRATVDVNGLAVQKWPDAVKALHEASVWLDERERRALERDDLGRHRPDVREVTGVRVDQGIGARDELRERVVREAVGISGE